MRRQGLYGSNVIAIGRRRRKQPAPPRYVFEALVDPDRDPARPWLRLLDDEQRPSILRSAAPTTLAWSSLWTQRPDAVIEFDLDPDPSGGTALQWTLYVDDTVPADALIGHMRKRLNELINADLRSTFGQ